MSSSSSSCSEIDITIFLIATISLTMSRISSRRNRRRAVQVARDLSPRSEHRIWCPSFHNSFRNGHFRPAAEPAASCPSCRRDDRTARPAPSGLARRDRSTEMPFGRRPRRPARAVAPARQCAPPVRDFGPCPVAFLFRRHYYAYRTPDTPHSIRRAARHMTGNVAALLSHTNTPHRTPCRTQDLRFDHRVISSSVFAATASACFVIAWFRFFLSCAARSAETVQRIYAPTTLPQSSDRCWRLFRTRPAQTGSRPPDRFRARARNPPA